MYLPIYSSDEAAPVGSIATSAIEGFYIDFLYPTELHKKGQYAIHASAGNANPIIYLTSSNESAVQICNILSTTLFGANLFDSHPELFI